jgi:hypothetical protein
MFALVAILITSSVATAQNARLRTGEEPPRPLKGEIHAIADPAPLCSFKDLCERADMIVEGVVETDAVRRMPGRNPNIETAFWIAVNRVIKGPCGRKDCPELKIVVLETNDDPRSGTTRNELVGIAREEPDVAKYRPPADYVVHDVRLPVP